MVCADVPLKLTVLGVVDVTLRVPAVMVNTPAMPSMEFADNCREVPFKVTLKRLAVPLRVLTPVKVAVPAVAVKEPPTSSEALTTEKETAVEIVPEMTSVPKLMVPAPEIVLDVPDMVTVPPVPVKLPPMDRLPVSRTLLVLLIVPEIVRLSSVMLAPVMLLVVPLIVSVPPARCVKVPGPVVVRSPETVMALLAAAVILVA